MLLRKGYPRILTIHSMTSDAIMGKGFFSGSKILRRRRERISLRLVANGHGMFCPSHDAAVPLCWANLPYTPRAPQERANAEARRPVVAFITP